MVLAPAPHPALRALKESAVLDRTWAAVLRVAEVACVLGFAVLFGVFVLQVFFRYVLNDPLPWSQEVTGTLFVWIVCVGSATLVKEREHVSFDLIYHAVRPRHRRVLAVLGTATILVVFLVVLWGNLDHIHFTRRQKTPTLRLPMTVVYSAFGVFMVLTIAACAMRLRALLGRRWDEEA
jgi:TRAP-type C4-dicarboxylate transport system permease small subunit